MSNFSLSHLSDHVLLRDTATLVAQDRTTTAALLAHLAEVDARKLYLPAAYPSMYAWCVGELRLSEDAAFRRIRAARTAREFPAIFPMLADGRLSLSAVLLLTPCLSHKTADELLAAAANRSRSELERLLAERDPKPDVPSSLLAVGVDQLAARPVEDLRVQLAPGPVQGVVMQHAPGRVGSLALAPVDVRTDQLAPAPVQEDVNQHAVRHVAGAAMAPARLSPLSPGRFALQVTIRQQTRDRLRYAQALLGHAVPSGDLAQVLDRALEALVQRLEQQRFAATSRSRPSRRRRADDSRHIPAAVRRAVWQRDGGRCTFVSDKGHRCEATARLEFDHTEPFARGGSATPSGPRLRCRAHNQYAAERVYGSDFMRHKREQAQRRAAELRAEAEQRRTAEIHAEAERRRSAEIRAELQERERAAARKAREDEVIPYLNALGCRGERARQAAALTVDMADATLEQRVRRAVQALAPASARRYSADGRLLTDRAG